MAGENIVHEHWIIDDKLKKALKSAKKTHSHSGYSARHRHDLDSQGKLIKNAQLSHEIPKSKSSNKIAVGNCNNAGPAGSTNCTSTKDLLPTYLIVSIDDFAEAVPGDRHSDLQKKFKELNLRRTYFPFHGYNESVWKQYIKNENVEYGWHGHDGKLDVSPRQRVYSGINPSVIAWSEGIQETKREDVKENKNIVARGVRGAPNEMSNIDLKNINSYSLGDVPIGKLYNPQKPEYGSHESKIKEALSSQDKLVSVHLHSGRGTAIKDLETIVGFANENANVEIIFQSQIPDKIKHNNRIRENNNK